MALYQNPLGKPPVQLPHPNEDPAHLAARKAKADYYQVMQEARSNWRASDLEKAEKIDSAYQAYAAQLSKFFDELYAQRRKRLEWAERQVPFGPGVAEGTSPADKAVLTMAFRSSLDKARATPEETRFALLREAEAYDDDMMRRALLTVAAEEGQRKLIDEWAASRPGQTAIVNEVLMLRDVLMGRGQNRGFERVDFTPDQPPQEVRDLPSLRAAQERLEERRRQDIAAATANRAYFRP